MVKFWGWLDNLCRFYGKLLIDGETWTLVVLSEWTVSGMNIPVAIQVNFWCVRKDVWYLSVRQQSCNSLLEKALCCSSLFSAGWRGWSGIHEPFHLVSWARRLSTFQPASCQPTLTFPVITPSSKVPPHPHSLLLFLFCLCLQSRLHPVFLWPTLAQFWLALCNSTALCVQRVGLFELLCLKQKQNNKAVCCGLRLNHHSKAAVRNSMVSSLAGWMTELNLV